MCFGGETKKNLFLGLCPKYPVFAQKTDFFGEKDILCPKGTKVGGEVTLLLRHWYEIMELYYVKSVLTEISASR